MDHVRADIGSASRDICCRVDVAWADLAAHGNARQAKGEVRSKPGELSFRLDTARRRIRDQADAVSTRNLAKGQVNDMPEEPADRRAKHMQNIERRLARHVNHMLTLQ
jgi:hypothetical protein